MAARLAQLDLLSWQRESGAGNAPTPSRLPDANPATVRSFDPIAAQRELEVASDRILADAIRRLNGINRKTNPEAYGAALADVHSAREGWRAVRIFGPAAS